MPSWLIFCLASQLAWAMVYVLDSYCVKQLFLRSWFGGVVSALCMAMLLPLTGAGAWFVEPPRATYPGLSLALMGGLMHMLGQFCYFRALRHSESGIISAYFNMTPLLVPVGAWLLLGERLGWLNYAALLGLVVCSVSFCLLDTNQRGRWESFGLMLIASVLEAGYLLTLKQGLELSSTGPVFIASTFGMMLIGFLPLVSQSHRREFQQQWPQLRLIFWLVMGIELVNLAAIYLAQRALELGSVSQVAGVEATTPAVCFLLSWLLWKTFGRIGDPQAARFLPQKLSLTAIMALLIWMLAQ